MNGTAPVEINSWERVRAELMRRIGERIWKPGDRIPGEEELAREFGCARATVSRAMRELADSGLIERRRRAGSRVRASPDRKAVLRIPIIRLEIEGRGMAYRHRLVEKSELRPPVAVAARLGLPTAETLLHLRSVHMGDGRPFACEDRWLNPGAVPGVGQVDLERISINEWLVLNAPFTGGDIRFSAAAASGMEAESLSIEAGLPVFVVERTTWNDDTPITWVRLAYPSGYSLTTRI